MLKGKKASCRYSFIVSFAPQPRLRAGAIVVNCIKESLDQRDYGVGITFRMISIPRVFSVANLGLLKVDITLHYNVDVIRNNQYYINKIFII